jgi:hypothetical protein
MGTVPRQESVSNCSMQYRDLFILHCWFGDDCGAAPARAARARRTGKIKYDTGSRAYKL